MLNRLVTFALKERLLIIIGTLFLAVFGIYSFQKLPIDAFPDVTNIQVQIITEAPGMSPIEVEKLVTFPIEIQMSGLPRLVELRSLSKPALSVTTVVFEDGVDIYFARQQVLERLIEAKEKLPEGVEPSLGPISSGLGEIFQYTIETPNAGGRGRAELLTDLRTYQDWIVRPILKSVPGVVDVNSFGGFVKQYQVIVDPQRLRKFGLTLRGVFEAVASNNSNVGGNILEHFSEQYLVRGVGLVKSLEDIKEIVVKEHGGTPILLRDVAEVKIGPEVRQGALLKDGREEVAGIVMMLRGGNSREIVTGVKAKVKEINSNQVLPNGAKIEPFYDRSELVEAAVGTVRKALLEGSILVILILFLMLGNVRSALIVTLSMPLAVLFTFIMMRLGFINLSANLMTLGGLAIAIGMIVDGSVVMVENIYRHLSEKKPQDQRHKLQIILASSQEVARPIVFGIGIIIIVFLPLFSLQGIEGKMFTPLASTICLALFGSILISLLVAPVLSSLLLTAGKEEDVFLVRVVKKTYLPLLHWVLKHKKKTVFISALLLFASLSVFPLLGTEFIPTLDEGSLTPQIIRLPDISLTQSVQMEQIAHRLMMKYPEIQTVVSKIGTAEIATDPMG
ncbi:MAG: efflux RND transporter permease subunit, partial [Limisphaerales bacterium]